MVNARLCEQARGVCCKPKNLCLQDYIHPIPNVFQESKCISEYSWLCTVNFCTCVSGESAVMKESSTTKILPVAVHCIYTLSIFPSDKYQAWNTKNAKKKN